MAQLIVRKLEDRLVRILRRRAAEHGRSAEEEHREILKEALQPPHVGSLKQRLVDMPDVGQDDDFARQDDAGRETPF